jgi:threonine dehydratase
MTPIRYADVEAAQQRIAPYVRRTPFFPCDYLNRIGGRAPKETWLKVESLQATGSFKIRGAANCILTNLERARSAGVVTASAGNHAQGVARMAYELDLKATIVMPVGTPPIKVSNTQRYGAEVLLHGRYYDESYDFAKAIEANEGRLFVHPFLDPLVAAGQGTAAIEMLEEPAFQHVDSVVIPVGGGGLALGCATVLREKRPDLKLYGVTPKNAEAFWRSYHEGRPVEADVRFTLAEGTATKRPNPKMVEALKGLLDDVFALSEESIAHAIALVAEHGKLVVEGSGALPVAACVEGLLERRKTALIVSGGNLDIHALSQVLQRGLAEQGRLRRYRIRVPDRPGGLLALTQVIAESQGNILQVFHHRGYVDVPVGETQVELELETRGSDHAAQIEAGLSAKGFTVETG